MQVLSEAYSVSAHSTGSHLPELITLYPKATQQHNCTPTLLPFSPSTSPAAASSLSPGEGGRRKPSASTAGTSSVKTQGKRAEEKLKEDSCSQPESNVTAPFSAPQELPLCQNTGIPGQ